MDNYKLSAYVLLINHVIYNDKMLSLMLQLNRLKSNNNLHYLYLFNIYILLNIKHYNNEVSEVFNCKSSDLSELINDINPDFFEYLSDFVTNSHRKKIIEKINSLKKFNVNFIIDSMNHFLNHSHDYIKINYFCEDYS